MKHIDHILSMRQSMVRNYGLPAVDSSLISNGIVRLFESHREQQEAITPHSHKFNFSCLVLQGRVTNRIWTQCKKGDDFAVSKMHYLGDIGKYDQQYICDEKYSFTDSYYNEGDWYSMDHHEIHSIYFSAGCKVLFFEGEKITNDTIILEPSYRGKPIKTFEVKPWMFEREK